MEGDHTVEDALWNFNDILHHNYVHPALTHIPSSVGEDLASDIRLQKFFGILLPVSNVGYISGNNRLTSHSTVGTFTMINETRFEKIGPLRARAITNYTIAATPFLLAITFPFIKRSITKNFDMLMKEDFPMRERRGELRKMGFQFIDHSNFIESMNVNDQLITPPSDRIPELPINIKLSDLDSEHILKIGDSDHFGLQLRLKEDTLQVFPRLCPHEGACLDLDSMQRHKKDRLPANSLACIWHGRKFKPILSIPRNELKGIYKSKFHHFYFEDGNLNIHFQTPETPLDELDWTISAVFSKLE